MGTDLTAVHVRVSEDHAILRGLMRALVASACAAERDATQRSCVLDVLAQLQDETERHFAYEENVLGPVLGDDLDSLLEEHTAQRAALRSIAERVETTPVELAPAIDLLFDSFEIDMAAEEARLRSLRELPAEPLALGAFARSLGLHRHSSG